jgi:hypothetical protein
VGMLDSFQNVNLSGDSLDVSYVCNLRLFEDFYRYFFLGRNMGADLDFAKSSLTDRFAEYVLADLSLVGLQLYLLSNVFLHLN